MQFIHAKCIRFACSTYNRFHNLHYNNTKLVNKTFNATVWALYMLYLHIEIVRATSSRYMWRLRHMHPDIL